MRNLNHKLYNVERRSDRWEGGFSCCCCWSFLGSLRLHYIILTLWIEDGDDDDHWPAGNVWFDVMHFLLYITITIRVNDSDDGDDDRAQSLECLIWKIP